MAKKEKKVKTMSTNQGLYCEINLPTGDTVTDGPRLLPKNYNDYQGDSHKNVNDTAVWSDPKLRQIGWYPYVENDPGPPGPYYTRTLSDFIIGATTVSRNVTYTQQDIEAVKNEKVQEMRVQLVEYTANEVALNPKINDYVNDETKWFTDKQADLARITDYATAVAFDTTKPSPLVLANSYVGQVYVNQGLRMRAENDTATAAGVAAPWDSVSLNNFITGNNLAANDVSDATAPVQPDYKIRQGVATPGEFFARVIIWREARDDANPALRTTYKMRLLNRQDARNLYVFSYTNGTYLTWRQFLDIGGGIWELEATSAEWQYVPNDMGFIFSYGTNPAVEADYFTDRVEFPAGVQTKQILVAWDAQ